MLGHGIDLGSQPFLSMAGKTFAAFSNTAN